MSFYGNENSEEIKKITYTITIDPRTQLVKPPKNDIEFGIITNNLKTITEVTIDDFQKITSQPLSFTWFGGTFTGSVCNENWYQQSVFALDFDKGLISVEDAIKRLNDIDIFPQLWYITLSSSKRLLKFRIVLFLDTPILYIQHRDNIVEGLLSMFPEADQSCNNAGRIFLGGIESHIINYNPISAQILLDRMCINIITKDKGRVRNLNRPTNDSSCKLGEKEDLLYSIYKKYQNSPTGTSDFNSSFTNYVVGQTKLDFEKARKNVKILDEFLKGTWLYHNELFGLATNMKYIRGGMKLMKNTMIKYNELGVTEYTENNFNILKYVNNVDYYPQVIHKFSKYKEDDELYDIISATKNIRGHIETIEPINKMSLLEAEKLFQESFTEAINDTANNIYLFVLPTAIGKTESLTNINATIAAPTNDLKNEIGERMKVEYVKTPDPIKFENESINRKIDYFYRIGKPKKVISVLHDITISDSSLYSDIDRNKASEYLNNVKKANNSNKAVLTTHARALYSSFNNDTIIFDEDPINSLIEIKQMDITDLRKISYQNNSASDLNNVIDMLESSNKMVIYPTPVMVINIEEMIENVSMASIETNVFDFFLSSYYMRDDIQPHIIHYVIKRQLPENKKIIILSATLSIYIYKKLFGERLKIIDIKDVEQLGEVIQYTKRSCSRNTLKNYIRDVNQLIGDKPVLTFKSYGAKFNNAIDEMYFGNCSGYDSLKGKDIAVVGTPHRNNVQYLMTAKILEIDFKTTDITMSFQKIEHNGFRFMFYCFDNIELREIQLSFIESDLIQSVGRARTLREPARVEVYSNFPLRISDRFVY